MPDLAIQTVSTNHSAHTTSTTTAATSSLPRRLARSSNSKHGDDDDGAGPHGADEHVPARQQDHVQVLRTFMRPRPFAPARAHATPPGPKREPMTAPQSDFLRTITARGQFHQCTDLEGLDKAAAASPAISAST